MVSAPSVLHYLVHQLSALDSLYKKQCKEQKLPSIVEMLPKCRLERLLWQYIYILPNIFALLVIMVSEAHQPISIY